LDYEWIETDKGNWVLPGDDEVEATVYRAGSEWGAVWNGAPDGKARRLKAKHSTAREPRLAVQAAIETDAQARAAVDAFARGSQEWHWVTYGDAAA
jgi:hypothetical protein